MRALESYKFDDERGKDEGANVRHRVKLILELLNDYELLRNERRKAKADGGEKYQGFSKDDMLYRGGSNSSEFDSFERWNEKKVGKDEREEKQKSRTTPKLYSFCYNNEKCSKNNLIIFRDFSYNLQNN
uniref:ENTH domain-containing protein n=1 Tax=Meloidogyne enterolobii TaxID=390850 RepID=A0A6V7U3B5_MELEN|nr:unnamed protein product [Meloidogyne enterolobii]